MKALVIGAAGGFGGTTARELISRGHSVRALVRPGGRAPALERAELVTGDALDLAAVDRAARGVDAIVWGFHVPYPKWEPGAVEAARVTAEAAARNGATILFPGNVYGLGAGHTRAIREDDRRGTVTHLGAVRNRIEGIVADATARGARAVVVRAGDYLGPHASNSWLDMLTGRALRGGFLLHPGGDRVPHAWAYLPDVCRAGVELLERRDSFAAFDVFHFDGYTLDTRAMLDAVRAELGDPARRTVSFPWWLVRVATPFSRLLRHVVEMRYLWEEPVTLDGTKLRRALPGFTPTPLDAALRRTLAFMAERDGVARARVLPLLSPPPTPRLP